jgi:hypothetical protein
VCFQAQGAAVRVLSGSDSRVGSSSCSMMHTCLSGLFAGVCRGRWPCGRCC